MVENYKLNIADSFWKVFEGKKVLVTGNTGFKGSWLSIWLNLLGANVIGYSKGPPTNPNNFDIAKLDGKIIDIRGDIRDYEKLFKVIQEHKPEIIFHLAAQPIILTGIQEPKLTFETNVIGTMNILEAVRNSPFVKSLVCITSDKCYKNQESLWGYKEIDTLGGEDPYSASKAMAEIIIESYVKSYFGKRSDLAGVASVRAGNVIGGGDFAPFRLVPDIMKSLLENRSVVLRNPESIRPWQHVLIPLSGYLCVAANIIKDKSKYSQSYNFGPIEMKGVTTKQVTEKMLAFWGTGRYVTEEQPKDKVETSILKLNWEKASQILNWHPSYNIDKSLSETVEWLKKYKMHTDNQNIDMYKVCEEQITRYTLEARENGVAWTK